MSDFELPQTVDDISSIDEAITVRDLYARASDEGPFSLRQPDWMKTSTDTDALQKTIKTLRSEVQGMRSGASKYEGVDLDNYQEHMRELEELRLKSDGSTTTDEKVAELVEARMRDAQRRFDQQMGSKDKDYGELKSEVEALRSYRHRSQLRADFGKVLVDKTGKRRITSLGEKLLYQQAERDFQDRPEDGMDWISSGGDTMEGYLESFLDAEPEARPGAAGGGAPGSTGRAGGVGHNPLLRESGPDWDGYMTGTEVEQSRWKAEFDRKRPGRSR